MGNFERVIVGRDFDARVRDESKSALSVSYNKLFSVRWTMQEAPLRSIITNPPLQFPIGLLPPRTAKVEFQERIAFQLSLPCAVLQPAVGVMPPRCHDTAEMQPANASTRRLHRLRNGDDLRSHSKQSANLGVSASTHSTMSKSCVTRNGNAAAEKLTSHALPPMRM